MHLYKLQNRFFRFTFLAIFFLVSIKSSIIVLASYSIEDKSVDVNIESEVKTEEVAMSEGCCCDMDKMPKGGCCCAAPVLGNETMQTETGTNDNLLFKTFIDRAKCAGNAPGSFIAGNLSVYSLPQIELLSFYFQRNISSIFFLNSIVSDIRPSLLFRPPKFSILIS